MELKPISSIQELKDACLSGKGEYVDFRLYLAGGLCFSSKRMIYHPDENTFSVVHEISDSYQDDLTETELREQTNVVLGIENNAFVQVIF